MIPKIIHWCWLSKDAIPQNLVDCMESWKMYLPEYEWVHWDFDRFDKTKSKWVSEAFDNKKYAFAADYIRLYALYNYGGIYLDMDVEVLRSFNDFLELSTMLCYENSNKGKLEVAAFGVEKKSEWIRECLRYYENRSFVKEDGSFDTKVLPIVIRDCLIENGYKVVPVNSVEEAKKVGGKEIPVFPFDFFSPKSYETGKIEKTDRTYSIHHFASSWMTTSEKVHIVLWRALPKPLKKLIKYYTNKRQ